MTALILETTNMTIKRTGGRTMQFLGDISRTVGVAVDGPLPGFIYYPHKVAMPSKDWFHFKNFPGVEMLYNPLTYKLMWRCCWCHIPVHTAHCQRDECIKETWWNTLTNDRWTGC